MSPAPGDRIRAASPAYARSAPIGAGDALAPQPFRLHVADAAIDDLRERLARTRFPDQAPGEPWAYGTDVAYLQGLVEHWRTRFDWRAQEARLNAFPQFTVPLHGIDLHFLHVEGKGPRPFPLLLSHGWPGSVFEFLDIIPRLTDPARFGGDPADAFTVVAPSLPGYGLSFKPGQPRFGPEAIADCFAELMTDVLGYARFAAQGGDWGAFITSRLGAVHADKLIGIHLNLLALPARSTSSPNPDGRGDRRTSASSRPGSRRRRATSGSRARGRRRSPSASPIRRPASPPGSSRSSAAGPIAAATWRACSRATTCSPTSACTGSPARSAPRSGRTTPACTGRGRSAKAGSARRWATPRSRARSSARRARWPQRWYTDIRRWTEMPRGGHFAAMEQPEALAREIVEFFRPLRPAPS